MKKFFLILLINAPFLLNNTIKADTSQLFTLFDIRKENNVDNVSKLFLDLGFPAKEFYSGYDNTNLSIAILGYFGGKQIKKEQIQLKLQKEEKTKRKVISKEQYTQYVNELCDKYGAITRSIVYRQSCYGKDNIKYYQDILVFQKPKMIVFGNKEYHFENILSCSMYDENQNNTHISQVTKTKTGSMLGRAAVGALTFGVAGAVVGAVTAKKESASTITPTHSGSYIVKIGIKSVKEPTVTLDFGNDKSKAEEVYALMQAIIAMK